MLLYLASHSQYVASRNNWLAAWRHGGVIYWGYWKYQNDKQELGIWLCLHLGTCWCGGKANTYLKKSKFINFHWSSSKEKSLSTLDSNQLIPHQRNGKYLNVEHSSDCPLPTPHSSYLGSNKLHSLRCRTGEEAAASNLWYNCRKHNIYVQSTLHLPTTKLEFYTKTQATLRASCHIWHF